MDELGALRAIDPRLSPLRSLGALADVSAATDRFRALRPELAANFADVDDAALLAVWLAVQGADQDTYAGLALPRSIREASTSAHRLGHDSVLSEAGASPVSLHRTLARTPLAHLSLAWAVGDATVRANLERYVADILGARSSLTGDDLLRMGATPGPVYAQALEAVFEAMLEGRATDRESQVAVAQAVLDQSPANG
jgi:hypothetical protein